MFHNVPPPTHMPNFFVFVRSFQVLPRRIALFATLLISALALSVYQVPQQPENSRVIYSQDISLLTELPAHRHRLDYLLLAQPLADFPHYIIKYKDQTKLVAVKIPQTTQVSLEREVLLRNAIPYSIASNAWLREHPQTLSDPEASTSIWRSLLEFIQKNIIGIGFHSDCRLSR